MDQPELIAGPCRGILQVSIASTALALATEVRGTAVPQPCVTYGIHFFTIPIPRNSILAWFLSACLLSPLEEQAEKTPTHGLWGAAKFPVPRTTL
eukprot:scaffold100173_cov85-Cyclotella_meneghiniana.AAC.3